MRNWNYNTIHNNNIMCNTTYYDCNYVIISKVHVLWYKIMRSCDCSTVHNNNIMCNIIIMHHNLKFWIQQSTIKIKKILTFNVLLLCSSNIAMMGNCNKWYKQNQVTQVGKHQNLNINGSNCLSSDNKW